MRLEIEVVTPAGGNACGRPAVDRRHGRQDRTTKDRPSKSSDCVAITGRRGPWCREARKASECRAFGQQVAKTLHKKQEGRVKTAKLTTKSALTNA